MVWISDGEKCDNAFSRFDTIPARDEQTDRPTDILPTQLVVRAIYTHTRRAVKTDDDCKG